MFIVSVTAFQSVIRGCGYYIGRYNPWRRQERRQHIENVSSLDFAGNLEESIFEIFIDQASNEVAGFIDREYPAMEDIRRRYPEFSHDELLPLEEEMRKAFACEDPDEIHREITNLFQNLSSQMRRRGNDPPLAQGWVSHQTQLCDSQVFRRISEVR